MDFQVVRQKDEIAADQCAQAQEEILHKILRFHNRFENLQHRSWRWIACDIHAAAIQQENVHGTSMLALKPHRKWSFRSIAMSEITYLCFRDVDFLARQTWIHYELGSFWLHRNICRAAVLAAAEDDATASSHPQVRQRMELIGFTEIYG